MDVEYELSSTKMLLVDVDTFLIEVLTNQLQKESISEILTSSTIADAKEVIPRFKPDILLLNVNMPDPVVTDLDIYYTSNILYSLVNYTNYNYVLNTFVYDDLINNNIFKFIYISTTNTNILINRFEINSFINHSEINNTEKLNLNEIKNKYNILIY